MRLWRIDAEIAEKGHFWMETSHFQLLVTELFLSQNIKLNSKMTLLNQALNRRSLFFGIRIVLNLRCLSKRKPPANSFVLIIPFDSNTLLFHVVF
jgi:hypothetical protein